MGCGESKQAVATENTVVSKSNSKRSNSIKNNPTLENDSPVVKENEIPDAVKEEKSENKNAKETENGEKGKENLEKKDENEGGKENAELSGTKENLEGAVVVEAVEEKKGETENKEKDDEIVAKEEIVVGEEGKKDGPAISNDSQSEILPSDATVESVISEGVSGKSEYHSPPASPGPEHKVEGDAAVEGKEINGEAKQEEEKEDGDEVDEGKEVVPAPDETKGSDTTREEKIPAAGEEDANAASPTEVKAD